MGEVKAERKTIIIGWDGATWDLLGPWVAAGKLPNLARLMRRGVHGVLQSTPMPLSPAAWSTIITGQNPGKHGVFDWFERKADSYTVEYVHTGRIGAKPIWEYFNAGGNRIGIFNPPMLYPAVPVDGFMISGMAAPSSRAPGFAYPSDLLAEIEANLGPYAVGESEVYKYGREEVYLHSILSWLDYQRNVVHYLIENEPCDAYLFVFMQSDHIQHKFWRYLDPNYPGYDSSRDGKYRDAIYQVYTVLDDVLGELMTQFGEDAHFVLLSDHGAGPNYGVMYINRWLEEIGLLRLKMGPTTRVKYWLAKSNLILRAYRVLANLGLGRVAQIVSKPARDKLVNAFMSFDDIDWSRTKAYSRGAFGQIYLNQKVREPLGIVEPGEESERVIAEIITGLRHLKHPETGERLITEIHRREEVLNGPYVERAADITFAIQNYAYGSSIKLGLEGSEILGPSEYEDSGSHRPEGILVMAGPGFQPGAEVKNANVADIAPTVMALTDLPVPIDLDGRIISEVFTPEIRTQLRFVEEQEREPIPSHEAPDLNADEVAKLEARLRSLGYLG